MTAPGAISEARRQLLEKLRHGKPDRKSRSVPLLSFRPAGSEIPLSPGQEHVWLHAQLAGEAPIYNESVTIHRRGPLDALILERCFQEIARRHEIWRSTFPAHDGKVIQQIEAAVPIPLPYVDLSGLPAEQREEQAVRMATEDVRTPFDLSRAPLFRLRLVRCAQDYHRIYVTAHHLVFDGVSLYRILLGELSALYAAFSAGQPSPLAELSIQYRDYAGWKRHLMAAGTHAGELKYWRETLAGDLPALELPADHPRPAQPTWPGGMETCTIPAHLMDALGNLCKSETVTRYMLLLAVFQVLLYRYSGQEEVVVGGTINTRTRPELDGLIGYFLNTVVLRSRLTAKISFREFLAQVKSTVLGALAHSEIPFDAVVRELAPRRDSSAHPLFQVLFSMRPPFSAAADGWDISSMEIHNGASTFDLFVEFSEQPQGLRGRFVYNSDLFERATIRRLMRHFQILLEELLAHPDQAVSKAKLLAGEELKTLLVDWNHTERKFPASAIHQMFEARAESHPWKPALVFRDRELSYGELNARSNQLAHDLVEIGAGPGSFVGLYMERSLEMVIALLAVLKSGAAYIPYEPELPWARLKTMLEDSQPVCVIAQRKFAKDFEYSGPTVLVDSPSGKLDRRSIQNPRIPVGPEDPIYAIYTSGSTGVPKAAINSHEAVSNRIQWMQHEYRLEPRDRVLQKTPYSFDVSVWEFFWPLTCGATLVIAEPGGHKDPAYIASLIGSAGITTIHFVPSMLREFLEAGNLDRCSSLQRVFSSGEALPPDVCEKFQERLHAELHNLYGPTEAAVDVTYWDCDQPMSTGSVPIGRPISNVRIYILDRHLAPVPVGVAGELYIGGVAVGLGYLNRPELTRERFIQDPFRADSSARLYRTGDRARFLADGSIEYLGRLDNQAKLRGFRIELGEIDAALAQSDQVVSAAAIVDQDSAGGQRLVAYVVARQPKLDVQPLRAMLRQRLPEYMIPAAFVLVDELPRTSSGKLDKKRLPASKLAAAPQQPFAPASDEIEQRLTNLWEEMLGVQPIGVDDNYFDLGGHSLLAIRLFSQIHLSFQVKLPLATLFYAPTIRGMAGIIRDSAVHRAASPIVPIQISGTKPAIFCVGPLTGEVLAFRDLALELGPDQPVYGLQPFDLANRPATVEALAASYIEELQRSGHLSPFCIVGYSFGGLVALEIAQQLQRDGITPPVVVMIDTSYLIGCKSLESWRNRIRRYQYHVRRILRSTDGFGHLADLLRSRSYRALHRVSEMAGVGIAKIVSETSRVQLLAAENYRARPFAGKVYILKAETRPEFFDKPDLGWAEILDDLCIEDVPGDHATINTGENLRRMARKLAGFLKEQEDGPAPVYNCAPGRPEVLCGAAPRRD